MLCSPNGMGNQQEANLLNNYVLLVYGTVDARPDKVLFEEHKAFSAQLISIVHLCRRKNITLHNFTAGISCVGFWFDMAIVSPLELHHLCPLSSKSTLVHSSLVNLPAVTYIVSIFIRVP